MRLLLRSLRRVLRCAVCVLGVAGQGAAQNFVQPTVIPTGNWPTAVYAADVNGDGYADLLYVDQGATPAAATTHVLLNDGRGNFTSSATLTTAGDSIAIGDLTGQGHVDVGWLTVTPAAIAGQYTTTLTIAPGRGDGTFLANVSQSFVTAPAVPYEFHFLQAARLHPSGPLDVVAGDVKTGIVLDFLHTNSGAQATSVQILHPPDGVGPMTIADLNGDGANDLVVISASAHSAQVLLGFSGGGFPDGGVHAAGAVFTRFTGVSGVYSLAVRDVNLDGRPDLIAEGANGHIDVFFGNGDGTFQGVSSGGTGLLDGTTGNGGHLITVADLNGDGLPDALTATPAGVSALLGNGTAYLGLKGVYNAGPGRSSYAVADFDRDGSLDVALDSPEGIAILFGRADGSLQSSLAFAAGQPALSGALGAFHAGGGLDAVVSTAAAQAQVLKGAGDGSFTYAGWPGAPTPTTSQTGGAGLWSTVQVGDIDGDGKLDLLLTADGSAANLPATADGAVVQLGDGAGGFAAPRALAASTLLACPQAAGLLYGVSTLASGVSGTVIVNRSFDGARYYGNGAGSFPGNASYAGDVNGTASCGPFAHDVVIAAPFVTNGVPDVFVQADGRLVLYPSGLYGLPLARATGDLSADGSLTTPGQLTAPQLSSAFNGPAIPVAAGGLGFPAFIGSAAVADLDGDGNNDLVITYANLAANLQAPSASAPNYVYVWYGSGGGKFLTSAAHPVNPVRLTPTRNFYQAVLADVNLDGVPDLILSDGSVLSVQVGLGDGSFGPETHFLAGQGINGISAGDVNRDGKMDLVLANGGAVLANPVANLETLGSNAEVNTGGVTVLLNQAPARVAPAGTLTANPEPSTVGASFTLTANLAAAAGLAAPTGRVSFTVDGVAAGTATLAGGVATLAVPAGVYASLAAGQHGLAGVYAGDASYTPVTLTGVHVVQAAAATPTLTLTATPEPSTFGAAFTMTATLAGGTGSTGTFTFSVDGTVAGSVTSSTGVATLVGPSTLTVGPHALAVGWVGTSGVVATPAAEMHTVEVDATSLNLVLCVDAPGSNFPCGSPLSSTPLVSPVTMYFGQVLDGTAIESSTSLTGSIHFLANNANFCTITANLLGGGNACPPQAGNFLAGAYTVLATYSGDATNAPSQSNAIQVRVLRDLTMAAVGVSAQTAVAGAAVTLTGKVAGNFAVPGGPVQFLDGTTVIGTAVLDATGTASVTTTSLAVGSHVISIVYAGNANFLPATSASATVVITAAVTASDAALTLAASPEPSAVGAAFTITATLAGSAGNAGTFTFYADGAVLGSVASSTGVASLMGPSTLAVGPHALAVVWTRAASALALQATYTHTVVASATSINLVLCVDGPGSSVPCSTPLSSTPLVSPVTMYYGQVLDGTAIESSTNLTGNINFLANNASFCTITANVLGGANACPPKAGNFQAGVFTVLASYSGDARNAPAQSNAIQVRVLPDLTMGTVGASVQTAVVGSAVTFTGGVAGNFAVPGGPVQFLDGTTVVGTGTLDATGGVSLTTSSLTVGTHVVSIAYAGTANFLPAVSAGTTVTITPVVGPTPPTGPQSFTLSVSPGPGPLMLGVGRTGLLQVTITAVNGFAQPVALSCSGLPNETGCTFVNATIAPGGGATTLQFTTASPHACGDPSHPYFLGESQGPGATRTMWAGLVLCAAGLFRVRRGSRRAGLMVLLAGTLVGLSLMSGCGNCTDLGTRPGSYTFTVTASAQAGPVNQSASQVVPVLMTLP